MMDIETCLKKLGYVGVLDFATVDEDGAPQVRNISAIHYEGTTLYFLTARGKPFARQLKADGRVQILGYTKYHAEGLHNRVFLPFHTPHHEGVFYCRRCRNGKERLLHQ